MLPDISVIVPVYRDWDRLAQCLSSLHSQSLPRERFEIIIVDNDDDALAPEQRPQGVVYVHEPEGYSYAARNAGLAAARAQAVAFTDADCVPDRHWLERGLAALEGPPLLDLAGGRIELY